LIEHRKPLDSAAFFLGLSCAKKINEVRMSKYVFLNNAEHFHLKALNRYYKEAGDNKPVVPTFPTEFIEIQREYPILLRKDSGTEVYQAVALLGFATDENLFLADSLSGGELRYGWNGYYVPAAMARGPFIIGLQEQRDGQTIPMVYVDIESPKVSESEGLPLFASHGGNSEYLNYIVKVLGTIQQGMEVGKAMYKIFEDLELIEPLVVNISLKTGDQLKLEGYFTISEERLAGLSGENLQRLNKLGFLQGAYLMISSLSNLQRLIEIKNSRL
jgi:hypothetical protein